MTKNVPALVSLLACAERTTPATDETVTTTFQDYSDYGSDADTDADADSDADTDDTGTPPDRSGTYVGPMDLIAADFYGDDEAYALCVDPAFTLTIDAAGAVAGGGGCTMPYPLEGKAFVATLTGAVGVDGELGGEMTVDWPSVPMQIVDEWAGDFTDPDTIDGHFEGHWYEGDQITDWGAEFLLVR